MQALNRMVNAGKVHYLGISDSPAWVAMKANLYAQQHGLAQFSVYQGLYNAAVRDCEREIIAVCEDTGMAFVPYGAQGGGEFRTEEQKEALKATGEGRKLPSSQGGHKYVSVTEVLDKIAQKKGVKITQLVSHSHCLHNSI
jgi:aryl-alcohol dehydrogenase-like predicted oxidoreductase